MLVLTRKPGEQIVVGGNIRITVVSVAHGRVKIGVEAPPSVTIDRQEIFDRKQLEVGTPADTVDLSPSAADVATPTVILSGRTTQRIDPEPALAARLTADPRKPR